MIFNSNNQPVMIAGYFGKGRIFFSGHESILSDESADNMKFVHNVF